MQATESPITSWFLLASAVLFVFQAATAGPQQWATYSKLFDESRFCHVTTIDFLALTASAPVWMWNDAEVRQWQSRYLCLRWTACDLLVACYWDVLPLPAVQCVWLSSKTALATLHLCWKVLLVADIHSVDVGIAVTGGNGCQSWQAYLSLVQVTVFC